MRRLNGSQAIVKNPDTTDGAQSMSYRVSAVIPNLVKEKGLRAPHIVVLNAIAHKCRFNNLTRLTGTYLATSLGWSAQYCNQLLRELQDMNVIIRLRQQVFLCIDSLEKSTVNRLKRLRTKVTNFMKIRKNLSKLKLQASHKKKDTKKEEISPKSVDNSPSQQQSLPIPDRFTALQELRNGYIPVHLRKSAQ